MTKYKIVLVVESGYSLEEWKDYIDSGDADRDLHSDDELNGFLSDFEVLESISIEVVPDDS